MFKSVSQITASSELLKCAAVKTVKSIFWYIEQLLSIGIKMKERKANTWQNFLHMTYEAVIQYTLDKWDTQGTEQKCTT